MTTESRPLVSVVTPVYNGERYLRQCIESVLAQTYQHWDYTIVNNRSTDGTLAIALEYAARDPRIRIHNNQQFVRVIENHNIAFRQISPDSEYCKPLAADDWLFPECLERMVALAEQDERVAIVGAYGLSGTEVVWVGLPYLDGTAIARGQEACRLRLLGGPYVFGTPTSVLYRSAILRLRHAFYNEANIHADAEACLEFLGEYGFGFVHQVLTCTRVRDDSLTSVSRRLNTYLPSVVYELLKYGGKFLSEPEVQRRIAVRLEEYYRYLGRQVYRRRGREFWDFHRQKLAELGYPLSVPGVAAAALAYALDIVLNPKSSTEAVLRRVRLRIRTAIDSGGFAGKQAGTSA